MFDKRHKQNFTEEAAPAKHSSPYSVKTQDSGDAFLATIRTLLKDCNQIELRTYQAFADMPDDVLESPFMQANYNKYNSGVTRFSSTYGRSALDDITGKTRNRQLQFKPSGNNTYTATYGNASQATIPYAPILYLPTDLDTLEGFHLYQRLGCAGYVQDGGVTPLTSTFDLANPSDMAFLDSLGIRSPEEEDFAASLMPSDALSKPSKILSKSLRTKMKLTLHPLSKDIRKNYFEEDTGALKSNLHDSSNYGRYAVLRVHFTISWSITIAQELLEYCTNTGGTTGYAFSPAAAYQFLSSAPLGVGGRQKMSIQRQATLHEVTNLKGEVLKSLPSTSDLKPVYREEDRLLVLKNGSVNYLPPVPDGAVERYYSLLENFYDEDAGHYVLSEPLKSDPNYDKYMKLQELMRNEPLGEDWVTQSYFYTAVGTLQVRALSLQGATAPTNVVILSLLNDKHSFEEYLHDLWTHKDTADKTRALFTKGWDEITRDMGFRDLNRFSNGGIAGDRLADISNFMLALEFLTSDDTQEEITPKGIFYIRSDDDTKEAALRNQILDLVVSVATQKLDLDSFCKGFPNTGLAMSHMVYPVVMQNYLNADSKIGMKENFGALYTEVNDMVTANLKRPSDEEVLEPMSIAGAMTGMKTFPHQSRALKTITNPEGATSAVMAIQPGGGKTIISILDMLMLLDRKSISKPLLIGPDNLLGQWADAVNKFSDGNLNFFPITASSVGTTANEGDDLFERVANAPRNTIFLTSYNFLSRSGTTTVDQGGDKLKVYLNSVKMAALNFDYIVMDESHYLKNEASGRSLAVSNLTSRAKYLRFASGTVINNNPADLVGMAAQINSSIFGTTADFKNRYQGKDGKWLDSAASDVAASLRPHMMKTTAKRSDWAFMLPHLNEDFHPCEFTPAQREVYDLIIGEALQAAYADPAIKKAAKAGSDDATAERLIESKIKNYLIQCEFFLVDPESATLNLDSLLDDMKASGKATQDEDGKADYTSMSESGMDSIKKIGLSGTDLISPKVGATDDLLDIHFAENSSDPANSKVLVFCTNVRAVEHFYANTRHKDKVIAYHGSHKADLSRFYYDDSIRVMVATEKTVNTGFNFQFCTRLIRYQTLWSPGEQDQALSRIFRPDVENFNSEKEINFDWLVIEDSIDMTKVGRLVSKIVTNMRFDEIASNNPNFDPKEFPEIKAFTMNQESIRNYSTQESIDDYLKAYSKVKDFEDEEFKVMKKKFPDMIPIDVKPAPKDFKKLDHFPFVPDMSPSTVPNHDELGLVTYGQHTGSGNSLMNTVVMTEFGIGTIEKVFKDNFHIVYANGKRRILPKGSVFIAASPTETGLKLIAEGQAANKPLPKVDTTKDTKPTGTIKTPLHPDGIDIVDEDAEIELFAGVFNEHLYLSAYEEDAESANLHNYEFKRIPKYAVAELKTKRHADALIAALIENYKIPNGFIRQIERVAGHLHKNTINTVDKGDWSDIRNFWLTNSRTVAAGVLHPYVIVQNGHVFVAVSLKQPAAKTLRSLHVPGVKFQIEKAQYIKFFKTVTDVRNFLTGFVKQVTVSNKVEVLESLKAFIPKAIKKTPTVAPKPMLVPNRTKGSGRPANTVTRTKGSR